MRWSNGDIELRIEGEGEEGGKIWERLKKVERRKMKKKNEELGRKDNIKMRKRSKEEIIIKIEIKILIEKKEEMKKKNVKKLGVKKENIGIEIDNK